MFDADLVVDISVIKYARLHPIVKPSKDKPKLLKKLMIESVFRLAVNGSKVGKGTKRLLPEGAAEYQLEMKRRRLDANEHQDNRPLATVVYDALICILMQ